MQAMIFAAGLGTRLKPLTDELPKALIPIHGTALLEHTVLKLKNEGFSRIVVNVHHFAEKIIEFLNANENFGMDISISDESDALLETGGGIKKAWDLLDHRMPVLIHNVDILSNLDLKALYLTHLTNKTDATLVVSQRDTFRYFLFGSDNCLKGWINEKTGQTKALKPDEVSSLNKLAFAGIHVISPSMIEAMSAYPERFPITDFYLEQLDKFRISAFVPENLKMMDVGKIDQLPDAEAFFEQLS